MCVVLCDSFSRTEDLVSKKRHSEAARVLLDYAKDVREAVVALVGGNAFSEARRVVCILIQYPDIPENDGKFILDFFEQEGRSP